MIISDYGQLIKDHGFDIITWTLERSGPLTSGGGWYYQYTTDIHALHTKVGIVGIFSDWPATTTFYATCMGL